MAGQEIRLMIEPVRALAFGSISGTYMGVGTAISNPARIFWINNLTDTDLMCSFDGINDHFPLPHDSFVILDATSNKTFPVGFYLAEGTRLYVKELAGVAPAAGSVYFTVFYGSSI
jgi:hypothetical protein